MDGFLVNGFGEYPNPSKSPLKYLKIIFETG
jgi:hypothetical protein